MHRLAALLLAAGIALSFIQFQESYRAAPQVATPLLGYKHDYGHGSAVSLGGGLYFTAKHVVDAGEGLTLFNGRDEYVAKVERVWPDRDLALFRSEFVQPPVPIRCEGAQPGERVVATGYPLDMGYMRMNGFVGGTIKWDRSLDVVSGTHTYHGGVPIKKQFRALQWLDLRIAEGMSGGPVTDSNNRLVGISLIAAADFAGGMIPAPAICEALAQKE